MKIAFISNYYNHHQSELSKALFELTQGQFVFIQTQPMDIEREKLGWHNDDVPDYVKISYGSSEIYDECIKIINTYDVVIAGSAPEQMIKPRIKSGKLTFRYSERIFKKSEFDILRTVKYALRNGIYRNKNLYYLLSSAYAANDYHRCGVHKNKMFKWGYFPKAICYDDIENIIDSKEPNSILWVSRFINWKHPEIPIEIAKRLKNDGIKFQLKMIGTGELEKEIANKIYYEHLDDCVFMMGSMSPSEVRTYMKQSRIFLFTSDRNEGWGAVLNEAMNSGCSVVANKEIGSVPFMVTNEENGFIYDKNNIESLYHIVKNLLSCPDLCRKTGIAAYTTIEKTWNAYSAASRLINLINEIDNNNSVFNAGPCSRAELLKTFDN